MLEQLYYRAYDRPSRLENLEVEAQQEVDADEKGPYSLQSEVERIIKIRDKNATGDDDVLGGVLKLLREDGLRLMMELINNIYETGEWPKDFIQVTMGSFHQKPTHPLNRANLYFLENFHIYLSRAETFFPALYLEYPNQRKIYRMFKK
jgi:hypothetical protein